MAVRRHNCHVELGSFGTTNPVALLRHDPLGPINLVKVIEQLLGVISYPEIPLLKISLLNHGTGTLSSSIGQHLLVGEHCLVNGVPVHCCGFAIGQAVLKELQEDPLGPAHIAGIVALDLSPPVVHTTDAGDRASKLLDSFVGKRSRMTTRLNGSVLCRESETVEAHWRQDCIPAHSPVASQQIAKCVVAHMAHMRSARGVGVHAQYVIAITWVVVVHLVGALIHPVLLPSGLDRLRIVWLEEFYI